MPVNYQAPAPVANEAIMSGLLSRLAGARAFGGGGGGGGGGYAAPGPGAWGQVVQLRDATGELENRKQLAAIEGAVAGNLQVNRGQIQSSLQAQDAALRAWQFEQQVTAQEAAQLRADQRAINEIDADPRWSDAEKQEAKLMIKTRIDWVGQRQKRDLQNAQLEQARQATEAQKLQAQWQESRLKFAAAEAEGKLVVRINPRAEEEIAEFVRDTKPGLEQADPKRFEEEKKREAVRRGEFMEFAANPDGTLDPLATRYGGLDAPGAPGGRSAARGRPADPASSEVDLEKDALQMARDDKKADPSVDLNKRADEYLERLKGAAARGAANSPEGRVAAGAAKTAEHLGVVEADLAEATEIGLPAPALEFVRGTLGRLRALMTKYPVGSRPPEIQQQIDALTAQYKAFKESAGYRAAWARAKDKGDGARVADRPPGAGAAGHTWGTSLLGDVKEVGAAADRQVLKAAMGGLRAGQRAAGAVMGKARDLWNYLSD